MKCRMCNHNAKYIVDINGCKVTVCRKCIPWLLSFNRSTKWSRYQHDGKASITLPHKVTSDRKYRKGRLIRNDWSIHITYDDITYKITDMKGNEYWFDWADIFHLYRKSRAYPNDGKQLWKE